MNYFPCRYSGLYLFSSLTEDFREDPEELDLAWVRLFFRADRMKSIPEMLVCEIVEPGMVVSHSGSHSVSIRSSSDAEDQM